MTKKANGIKIQEMIEMPLHEILEVSEYIYVMRVPGGWIYEFINKGKISKAGQSSKKTEGPSQVFVPEPKTTVMWGI